MPVNFPLKPIHWSWYTHDISDPSYIHYIPIECWIFLGKNMKKSHLAASHRRRWGLHWLYRHQSVGPGMDFDGFLKYPKIDTDFYRFSMNFYGFLWIFYEFLWISMDFLWISMEFYGFLWISMDFYGFSMDFYGFLRISMDFLWISMDFYGFF